MNSIKSIISISLLLLSACSGTPGRDAEVPMYGGVEPTIRQQTADLLLIENATEIAGSRSAASEHALGRGWEAYYDGDRRTAVRRFNQAWLLDPESSNVMEAFGVYYADTNDHDEAMRFYQAALLLDPSDATAICNMGRTFKDMSLRNSISASERNNLLGQAIAEYERAAQIAKEDEHLGYIYYQWAVALAMKSDFEDAWRKVHLSRTHGGDFIEPNFLIDLAEDMPEPAGLSPE